jgi:hypothetical protein
MTEKTKRPLIPAGKYRARGSTAAFEEAEKTGKEFVRATFKITEGALKDQLIDKKMFLTDKALEYTIADLKKCGCRFDNDDYSDLGGFGSEELEITIKHREYEGRTYAEIGWIARAHKRLSASRKEALSERIKRAMSGEAATDSREGGDVPF